MNKSLPTAMYSPSGANSPNYKVANASNEHPLMNFTECGTKLRQDLHDLLQTYIISQTRHGRLTIEEKILERFQLELTSPRVKKIKSLR